MLRRLEAWLIYRLPAPLGIWLCKWASKRNERRLLALYLKNVRV